MQILPREQKKHEYNEAVKNRYKHLPEIKRIVRYMIIDKNGFQLWRFCQKTKTLTFLVDVKLQTQALAETYIQSKSGKQSYERCEEKER